MKYRLKNNKETFRSRLESAIKNGEVVEIAREGKHPMCIVFRCDDGSIFGTFTLLHSIDIPED